MVPSFSRLRLRRAQALGIVISAAALLTSLVLAGTVSLAFATHVTPIVTHNNAECADVDGGAGWLQYTIDDAGHPGPHRSPDGVLVVTLSFETPSETSPTMLNWSSNIGVEGVIVRGGQTGDNFYRYVPPATSDTDISADDRGTSQISNLIFCYLVPAATPTPTPTPTPVEATPTPTPTPTPVEATPTPTPRPVAATPTPTPTPEQGVQAGTGTPAATVPNTAFGAGDGSSPVGAVFILIALGILLALPVANVAVARRRR